MAPKTAKLALTALNAVGWVLMLAAMASLQKEAGKKALNVGVVGTYAAGGAAPDSPSTSTPAGRHLFGFSSLADAANKAAAPATNSMNPLAPYTFSYGWWMVFFQLAVGVVLTGGAAAGKLNQYRSGVAILLGVLTACTFTFTSAVFNSPSGLWAMTHDAAGKAYMVKTDKLAAPMKAAYNGVGVMFAGLIICDLCNSLLCLTLQADSSSDAAVTPAPPTGKKGGSAADEHA